MLAFIAQKPMLCGSHNIRRSTVSNYQEAVSTYEISQGPYFSMIRFKVSNLEVKDTEVTLLPILALTALIPIFIVPKS